MTPELEARIRADLAYQASRTGPPEGFPALPEIPAGRYTRQDFYDLEMAHVWHRSWLCIGREEEVRAPGSYMLFTRLGPSIVVVRGRDNVLRAFHNTCRHRGAKVVKDACGTANMLRCQYHSWAYDLEGRLRAVPDEADFVSLDKSRLGLKPVRCETFAGWIFLNLDIDARPLAEDFAPLFAEGDAVKMQNLRIVHRYDRIIDCNWKAALEAFQEVYHIRTIHRDTLGTALNHMACAIGLLPGGHSRMITGYHEWAKSTLGLDGDVPNIPTVTQLHRESSTSYAGFPNVVTPFRFTVVHFQLFWPRGPRQCEMQVFGIGPDWGEGDPPPFWADANARFRTVLEEDMDNLFSIQQSMESGATGGMRLNYQERRIYWMAEEIDRRIGAARIPDGLAVRQVLAPFMETPQPLAAE